MIRLNFAYRISRNVTANGINEGQDSEKISIKRDTLIRVIEIDEKNKRYTAEIMEGKSRFKHCVLGLEDFKLGDKTPYIEVLQYLLGCFAFIALAYGISASFLMFRTKLVENEISHVISAQPLIFCLLGVGAIIGSFILGRNNETSI